MDKQLLQRYIEGDVTAEEVDAVVDWLDKGEDNLQEYMALHKLYDISILNKPALSQPKVSRLKRIPFRRIGVELFKISAVFLLFVGLSKWNEGQSSDETVKPITYQTITVPAGQRAEVLLPDSTKIWLNAKTTLKYPTNFEIENRVVQLDGEAYFDVRSNEKHPFLVKTEKIDIAVYGTEFNVRTYSGKVDPEVALLHGSVELNVKGLKGKYEMKPNNMIRLSDGKLYVSSITQHDYFKWREGMLCFYDESIESIMAKLELFFDLKIDIRNKNLLKHHYNGKFRVDDGVEHVLKVLQLELPFAYTRDWNLNVITIK